MSKWPKTIPVLEAEHLIKGSYEDGIKHHGCLVQWLCTTFCDDKHREKVRKIVSKVAFKQHAGLHTVHEQDIEGIND
jgi:hypothetical protein